jgi:hypothetical protein
MILATSTVNDLASSTSAVFSGSLPLILLLFGIGVAFYIMRNLIALIPKAR